MRFFFINNIFLTKKDFKVIIFIYLITLLKNKNDTSWPNIQCPWLVSVTIEIEKYWSYV